MSASLKQQQTPENFQIDFQNTSVDIWKTKGFGFCIDFSLMCHH